jgi:vacuolar-type H+-ATPase subunit H
MGALTATTIGMGAKVATGAVQAGLSFDQYNKQRKLQLEAQNEARKALTAAKKRLEVNYMDSLSVIKEPYELQREALLSAGAQSIEAARESQRGVAGTAGRVQMAMNEGQAGIRTQMGRDMMELERLSAMEDSRLASALSAIEQRESMGAQLARREALNMQASAMQQGLSGVNAAFGGLVDLGTEISETTARNANKNIQQPPTPNDFSATSISGQSPMLQNVAQPIDINMQAPVSYNNLSLLPQYVGLTFSEILSQFPEGMDIQEIYNQIYG